jgi:two-component system chemotaxis sensor kinase CheA
MDDMDEIIQEFLVESYENLDQLDRDLVELEQAPTSKALLSSVFRTIHTIKGTSGFLALGQLESVAHVGENLLSRLRDGELVLTPAITSALLDMVDAVRGLLAQIEATGAEGEADHTELVARLTALQDPVAEPVAGPVPGPVAGPTAEPVPEPVAAPVVAPVAEVPTEVPMEVAAEPVAEPEPVVAPLHEVPAPSSAAVTPEVVAPAAEVAPVEETYAGPERRTGDETPYIGPERRSVADSTIRVDVELLDSLMNLVGELVLTRNQIVQRAASRQDTDLLRTSHRLNLIAGELQEGVMKTRMQPIDTVWSKLPRVVRDLSLQLGKSVRVQMEGRDTELDKTILESVKDPLTHLVRNSVDHGVETGEQRVAAGKPAEGTLTLKAFHEGGQVNIEISDDGAGIDPQKLRDRAVSRGILTAEAAQRMGDREALGLIFAPGFSTAEKVTNVSGRGVGMDVVKTNIEKIGGLVDVQSVLGQGTTIRIKIPLTLAIIPALVVTTDAQRYAIPQVNLLELVRLENGGSGPQIEDIQGTPVYRLRGRLLPLVNLREQLELAPSDSDTTYIAVLQADEQQFGLIVDDINDTEEIVVKPLGKQLRHVPLYAGATIMGDGHVALILDAISLAQRSGVISDGAARRSEREAELSAAADRDHVQLLLVGLCDDRRVGLPLAAVDRLEEFTADRLERIGSHEVVQYRDTVLPLVHLDSVFGAYGEPADGPAQVVVCQHEGVLVGFVVHQILDIVDAQLDVRSPLDTGGHGGSAVVSGRVTELVDVARAVSGLDPVVFDRRSSDGLSYDLVAV